MTLTAGVTSRILKSSCIHCVTQVPNVTLWYGVSCLLYLWGHYWDGHCWLWMMLELSSSDIPYVLNWRQIWWSRRSSQCAWENYESAPAAIRNDSPEYDFKCRSIVFRPLRVCLQAFPWPPTDQHTAITGNKAELAFIR
ncbi:hypothetical protein TNCV_2802261 [Trichonephila clavipes]|nr:hypothetical protein TNCV_2802261 [Trichonephila clavipes]